MFPAVDEGALKNFTPMKLATAPSMSSGSEIEVKTSRGDLPSAAIVCQHVAGWVRTSLIRSIRNERGTAVAEVVGAMVTEATSKRLPLGMFFARSESLAGAARPRKGMCFTLRTPVSLVATGRYASGLVCNREQPIVRSTPRVFRPILETTAFDP